MPTPVSALIHAATLVTAGIYLLLRVSPLLEFAPITLIFITWIGAITAFFAATAGITQNDMKRVIAYSTASQIGYLMIAVGLGQYHVALFHLANHACFKALLFLAAGSVIHAIADQQDLRKIGGLISLLPFTYVSILIGSLSLIAVPYLTGWWSKDSIIELAAGSYTITGSIAYGFGTLVATLTAFYSIRLLILAFFVQPEASSHDYEHSHEASIFIVVPLVVLSLFAILLGYIASDLFRGLGSDFLSTSLIQSTSHVVSIEGEFGLSTIKKLIPAIGTLVGGSLSV